MAIDVNRLIAVPSDRLNCYSYQNRSFWQIIVNNCDKITKRIFCLLITRYNYVLVYIKYFNSYISLSLFKKNLKQRSNRHELDSCPLQLLKTRSAHNKLWSPFKMNVEFWIVVKCMLDNYLFLVINNVILK